jgi:hypothetical protein
MTDVSSGGQVNVEITPANTLSNGRISFKNGSPVIQFIIGEQDRLLIGRSVRLVGNFRVHLNSTAGAAGMCVPANANSAELNLPSRLGTYAMIDQLVLKSQETHQVIEHIRHYSRFAASFLPITNALSDCKDHLSEASLVLPNYNLQKIAVTDLPSQITLNRTAAVGEQGNSFCMPLPCGLFNGVEDIPLSSTWGIKGLLVEVHLAPDSNVLFSRDGVAAPAFPEAFYELSNVRLIAEMNEPTPQMVSQFSASGNTFEYNSISSYFASINSTNPIMNFQLGMSRVLGVFCNFIPSRNINSFSADGTATAPLKNVNGTTANIDQVIFTRGGQRFPLEYNLDTVQKDNAQIRVVDSELQRQYLNALKQFSNLQRSSVGPRNTWLEQNNGGNQDLVDLTSAETQNSFGVGIAYDVISGDGVDFSRENWGLQMSCGLDSNRPHACYVFVHAKQTLVFNQTGLQIVN